MARSEAEVWVTGEGDNNVLLAQLSRALVKKYSVYKSSGQLSSLLASLEGVLFDDPLRYASPVIFNRRTKRFEPAGIYVK